MDSSVEQESVAILCISFRMSCLHLDPVRAAGLPFSTNKHKQTQTALGDIMAISWVNPSTVTLATRLQEKEILPSSEGTRRQRRRSVLNLCLSLTFWMIPSVFSYHDCILIWNNKESQRIACLSADIFHRAVGPRRLGWRPCHQSQGAGGKWLM